jgi:hypothetical protein
MHEDTASTEQPARPRFAAPVSLLAALACLAIGAGVSVWLGQDANWDLRNYHLYIGFAALEGRAHVDLAAAGLQSWLNPALDIPYAWLALGPLALHPRLLAAFMGVWYGALIFVALAFAATVYRLWPSGDRRLAIVAATLVAVTGAAAVSQVGTTFNEIQTATLVLAGCLLLTREAEREDSARMVLIAVAGVLLGLAVGLKFNCAVYAPAAAFALVAAIPRRKWIPGCISLAAGGLVGAAIGGGWWFVTLWERFGNPVFPFFNGVFHSAWYPPTNIFDHRFLPRDVWQVLFYPFYWLSNRSELVTEISFRDGRFAAAFACVIILAGLFVLGRRLVLRSLSRPQRFLLAFLIASYLLWLGTTSILRYAVPVEVCAGLALPLILRQIVDPGPGPMRAKTWRVLVVVLSALLLLTTHYPYWVRMPARRPVVTADLGWLPPNTLFVLAGGIMSYVAPFARPGTAFVGLTDVVYEARGYRLAEEAVRRIAAHQGPIFAVWKFGGQWRIAALHDMGLEPVSGACRTFIASYEFRSAGRLKACAAQKVPANLLSPFWKIAAQHYAAIQIPQPVPNWSYAAFVKAVGPASRGKRFVDGFEYLWARKTDDPRTFDRHIRPDTLYILDPSLRVRALKAMDHQRDLLATIDGLLVLAPGWHNCLPCARFEAPEESKFVIPAKAALR